MNQEINYFNQGENLLEKKRQEQIKKLAKLMHEEWRSTRRKDDNSFEPRTKKTEDMLWIKMHEGKDEVDIANTDFEKLPRDWQEENLLSAKAAIEKIEDSLNIIHDKWLDRNDQRADPQQKTQYFRLPK
jgi:hypothetical protein